MAIPKLKLPTFPDSRIHPCQAEVTLRVLQWARERASLSAENEPRFRKHQLIESVSHMFPDISESLLELSGRWVTLVFLIDDALDEEGSAAVPWKLVEEVKVELGTTFSFYVDSYLDACAWEKHVKINNLTLSPDDYAAMRAHTSAAMTLTWFCSAELDAPRWLLLHPKVMAARTAAALIVGYVNDGLPEQALECVAALEMTVPAEAISYLQRLKQFVVGANAWMENTLRYSTPS